MRYSTPLRKFAKLTPTAGGMRFEASYDAQLLSELKLRIPVGARGWDKAEKCWLIVPSYATICAELVKKYLDIDLVVPQVTTPALIQSETRLIKLDYLGRCKNRGTETSAFGYAENAWSVIFSEMVLRAWFAATPKAPDEAPTLYAMLAIKQDSLEAEIRAAYRRLARQWHPDVCREPDAAIQFKAISNAYTILSDGNKRRKYDAGLILAASCQSDDKPSRPLHSYHDYQAPLRCGMVLAEGKQSLDKFVVDLILDWQDIVDSRGYIMTSSWPAGAEHFTIGWVRP